MIITNKIKQSPLQNMPGIYTSKMEINQDDRKATG